MKYLSAREKESVFDLYAMLDLAIRAKTNLHDRAKEVKGLNRDLGLLASLAERVSENIIKTVPLDALISIRKNLEHYRIFAGVVMPSLKKDDGGVWISYGDWNTMIDALGDHCLGCLKSTEEQRKCPLKKAIDITAGTSEHTGGCDYAVSLVELLKR